MGEETVKFPIGRRLSTWKEIAGYFGRDERTVKRWESSRCLPVRRMPNGPRSVVFAYEGELANWLDGRAAEEPASEKSQGAGIVSGSADTPKRSHSFWRSWRIFLTAAGGGAVAVGVVVWLLGGTHPTLHQSTQSPAPNAEAASFYQAGLYEWQTRTPEGLTHAVDDFTQAIVHDPSFAPAYAGLAMCFDLLREYTTMAPEDAYPRARAAAERAIALDPALGNAHAALGFVDFYWSRDSAAARREFVRALALSSRDAMIHHWYATVLMESGDFAGAIAEIGKAEALDSESTAIRADKGLILYYAGRRDDAIALLRRLEQAQPSFYSTHRYLAFIAFWRGDDAGYLNELGIAAKLRQDAADAAVASVGQSGLAKGGREGMLRSILAEQLRLISLRQTPAYAVAITFAALGYTAGAINYLRRSIDRREPETIALSIDPAFARMHARAEFRALVSRAGAKAS